MMFEVCSEFEVEGVKQCSEFEECECQFVGCELQSEEMVCWFECEVEQFVQMCMQFDGEQKVFVGDCEVLCELIEEQCCCFEMVVGLMVQQVKEEFVMLFEEEVWIDVVYFVKKFEDEVWEKVYCEVQCIISMVIECFVFDYVNEMIVFVVMLLNDDMKGCIIGCEGCNICVIERVIGVDLIVDDMFEVVILSGFDFYCCEIVCVMLECFILDGCIYLVCIEEVVDKVKEEFDIKVFQEGEVVLFELSLMGVYVELVKFFGWFCFCMFYGQNVLQYLKEVVYIVVLMVGEFKVDVYVVKCVGFFYDIGKVVDCEMEGIYFEFGIEFLCKYGEIEEVVYVMVCYYGDYDLEMVEVVLVMVLDVFFVVCFGV